MQLAIDTNGHHPRFGNQFITGHSPVTIPYIVVAITTDGE